MTVGCFLGIRASYIDDAQDAATAYLNAINAILGTVRLRLYTDPDNPPDVYNNGLFGRSALDHHSARWQRWLNWRWHADLSLNSGYWP
jgi:hypothetical protein